MGDDEKKALLCKVVLIGETGVGKNSILDRYIKNTFYEHRMVTPGTYFITKIIYLKEYNKYIKFELWNINGQEKFRSLARVFYKNASVCILVYDITRRLSFEELKKFWIENIKSYGPSNLSKLFFFLIKIN